MRIAWVEPGVLAAGGIPLGQNDVDDLHGQGIRAIVTLTEQPLTHQQEITPELLAQSDIKAFHFPIVDQHAPEAEQIGEAMTFIEQMKAEGRPVYMHCHAGVGRTGTMLHVYYLWQGFSLDEAKQKVKTVKLTSQFIMLADAQRTFLEQFAQQKGG